MDRIQKFLLKLSPLQREKLTEVLTTIQKDSLDALDVKKLVGEDNLYRVRIGQMRIIFEKTSQGNKIINIDFRGGVYK